MIGFLVKNYVFVEENFSTGWNLGEICPLPIYHKATEKNFSLAHSLSFLRAVARSAKSVLAIVILSVCLSVRLSVRLSRPGTDSSPGEIETALRSLEVDYDNLLMKLN